MWTCPKCERNFKTNNQSHTCTNIDMGELFLGKPDALVLAFDTLLQLVAQWEPNSVGAAKNAIVFTSKKAWLIVRPMKLELDIKFYNDEIIVSEKVKKRSIFGENYAHHIRVTNPIQIDKELLDLIRIGHNYSLR